jgi:hypothetical protein
MGMDYIVWIIPRQRAFRPDALQVANLGNALRDGKWAPRPEAKGQISQVVELLPSNDQQIGEKPARMQEFPQEPFTPSWVEFHSHHELILSWYVQNTNEAGVEYPFTFDPYPDSGPPYFYIRVALADDYFHWTGENVMPFKEKDTQCTCGEQLLYRTGWAPGTAAERILRVCPACGRNFDLSGIFCDVLDGWTGKPQPLRGGLAFRFALVVDCHKYWPRDDEAALRRFQLRDEFLGLWRTHIGEPFEQVVTFD